jgi:K+-dependent Na+/Ca+ exchanger-like protein
MALLGYFFALIASFYLLAEISDRFFIPALDKIAHRFNMSHDMAGATLMAIGSSAPELFVAIIALLKPGDHSAIGVGTIVGSALFNLLVIIGASAIVRVALLSWQPVVRDLLFYGLAIIGLFFVLRDGAVSAIEASILVFIYGFYLIAVVKWRKWFPYSEKDTLDDDEDEVELRTGWKRLLIPLDYFLEVAFPPARFYFAVFFMSIIFIAGLCWVLVESAIGVSHILKIPEVIIGLTVLAIGTSVPDMISSVIVAKQGRGGMAVSNAVGSNIFDILIGLGLPWLLYSLTTGESIIGDTSELDISIALLFGSVVFIFIAMVVKKWKIGQGTGYILIGIYIIYVIAELINVYFL